MTIKNVKKLFSILLVLSFVFPIIYPLSTYAVPGDDPNMKDGIITWETEGRATTTSIYYRTVGWTIHKERIPSGNVTSSGIPYGNIMMQQKNEYPSTIPGNLITEFESSVNEVKAGLNQAKDANKTPLEWKHGETVYLSAITEVRQGDGKGGYRLLGTYKDLSKLKASQSWGNPSDFDQYFNKRLKLDLLPEEVHKIVKVNGEVVSDIPIITDMPGETHNVTFNQTYDYNGIQTTIVKSYFERRLERGKELFPIIAPDSRVTNRNITIEIGGSNVVAEYEFSPILKVEHKDLDTNNMLEEYERTTKAGKTETESAKTYAGKSYQYSEISNDGGKTWKDRSDKTTRNVVVNNSTVIRFNYSSKTELLALLNLTADPGKIEKDKKASVEFTLDASESKAKDGIVKYEFWFRGEDTDEFKATPDYTITNAIRKISKSDVEPKTTWYGKVRVTDSKGNISEATDEVYIEELKPDIVPEPDAEVDARLRLNVIRNSPRIIDFREDEWSDGTHEYYLDLLVERDSTEEPLDFILNGSESTSTNGIGNYHFSDIGTNYEIYEGSSSNTGSFRVILDPREAKKPIYPWAHSVRTYRLEATDSKVINAKDTIMITLYVNYFFQKEVPKVNLAINQTEFGIGEEAYFTPTFIETENTYPIESKWWEIYSESGTFKDEGLGEIPKTYELNVAEGKYEAKQYISYKDSDGNDLNSYAAVKFNVKGMRSPDVSIKSDKEVYIIPTEGIFTVAYEEHPKYSYAIANREYKLKNKNGIIIKEGIGTFPNIYNFGIEMDSGFYIAEQTIHWWELGELKTKTASCEFKLISPKPTADFRVDMKMTTEPTWKRIDVPGETGKQYKQIRIDLSPSIALNESLENPYPILFTSPNTQIQVLPLTDDGQAANREKNTTIHTPNAPDKQLVDDTVTFKGKQFIDVRFDAPGKYRIKTRVANQHYIGNWLVRDITIREDRPPIVDLEFEDIVIENDINKVYRDPDDLKVRFNVKTKATPQDEDVIDPNSAKLEMRFDYNADNDASNDGVHSAMYVTKTTNSLQNYVSIGKNEGMDRFNVEMYSTTFPILGKMRFEYMIGETPIIPNFIGGSMPPIKLVLGTTAYLPIDKKILLADNRPGNIKVEMGKESKVEITIIMGNDTLYFDINTLKQYYGENAKIYIVDKNGNRELVN